MAAAVELLSVQALTDIRDRLARLNGRVRAHADGVRDHLRRQSRWLEDIGRERRDALEEAYRAVTALDEDDDGETERDRLREAEEAMREFREVAREYEGVSLRFAAEIEDVVDQGVGLILSARTKIETKIEAAQAYLSIQPMASVAPATGRSEPGTGGPVTTPAPSWVYDKSGRGQLPAGFSWVAFEQIAEEDFITDPALFKHFGRDEMLHGIALLRDDILPRLNDDPTLGRDDFELIDQQRGTAWTAQGYVHPDSLAAVWSAFLDPRREAEVIVIDPRSDGTLDVISGRHRLGLARKMGLTALPCKMLGNTP